MEKSKFSKFTLSKDQLKVIYGGDNIVVPVSTTNQINDFNSSRSNRERGN